MDKRMALAISADDVAPEVAETCFGNVGQVEDDDSADEDSADETSNEKNRRQPEPTSAAKKPKQNSLLQSNRQLIQSQQTSNPNSGENKYYKIIVLTVHVKLNSSRLSVVFRIHVLSKLFFG